MSSTLEAAHTPGPWMSGAGFGAHGMRVDALGGAKSICGVLHVWRDVHEPDGRKVGSQRLEEGWANLNLIVASPALLTAARIGHYGMEEKPVGDLMAAANLLRHINHFDLAARLEAKEVAEVIAIAKALGAAA